MELVNVFDYEKLAQTRMAPPLWDYYQGGSDDEVTIRACRTAFERIKLRPRVLVDVSPDALDMRTSVLGTPISMPMLIAPMALHCMAHPEGECATAQAAGKAGTVMIASTVATRTIEEIAQAADGPLWFQLYTYPSLKVAESLVRRAEAAGYRAIVLTVDLPVLGNREKDRRHNVTIPPAPYLEANFVGVEKVGQKWVPLTWDSLAWLRSITSLPIILKGILTAEDAQLAVEHGLDGMVVSNHGGRQLDTAIPSIEALPEIVEAVAGRCEIYLDGGIRRGTDILKALALGARAVLIGRPVLWGLAVNGAEGVYHVLELLRHELELAMALSGRPTLASIDRSLVSEPGRPQGSPLPYTGWFGLIRGRDDPCGRPGLSLTGGIVMVDWNRRAHIAESILDTAGMTPMVRLRRVVGDVKPAIVAKIEYFNPSGSVKDRILHFLVSEAERRGDLRPGMTIIEGTTGNTGIATSCVAAVKGYPVVIVMPDGMSEERKKTIRAYGAELVLTPGAESDVDLVIDKVKELKASSPGNYWEVGQFVNVDNIEAHYRTTGPEIWEQTEGKIGALVLSQGTGGTVTGAAKYLKEHNPNIKVFAVEPAECDILSGGSWGPHKIEGIGDGFIPEVLHVEYLDGVVTTTSDESIEMARRLAREEGIFCGISSGCNVAAAIKVAQRYPDIGMIVTVLSDNGLRYFSTELCGVVTDLEVPDREHPISDEDRAKLAKVKLEVIH